MDNISLFFLIFGASNKNDLLDFLMIFGAEYVIYLMIFLIFAFAIKGKMYERKSLILFLISFPILILVIKIIHLFFFQPRPYIENDILPLLDYTKEDASFPSRHTAISFIMALPYLYYKSKWAFLLLFLATWVGISRVYAGVHYPIDIVGGTIVGVISLIIAKQIIYLLRKTVI